LNTLLDDGLGVGEKFSRTTKFLGHRSGDGCPGMSGDAPKYMYLHMYTPPIHI